MISVVFRACIFRVSRELELFTNGREPDPKSTRSVFVISFEVNEQLIPIGFDGSRLITATECLGQWSIGVSSVVDGEFVTTMTFAFCEIEIEEVQAHML